MIMYYIWLIPPVADGYEIFFFYFFAWISVSVPISYFYFFTLILIWRVFFLKGVILPDDVFDHKVIVVAKSVHVHFTR